MEGVGDVADMADGRMREMQGMWTWGRGPSEAALWESHVLIVIGNYVERERKIV